MSRRPRSEKLTKPMTTALQRRSPRAVVIAQSPEELEALIRERGILQRSSLNLQDVEISDGIYYERSGSIFIVWTPTDPERMAANASIMPAAIELVVTKHPRGSHVLVRHRRNRTTTLGVSVLALGTVASFIAVALAGAGPPAWVALLFSLTVAWATVGFQLSVASERSNAALDAVSPLLGKLALPVETREDPYRAPR